jgi:adenylyl-sulfate kinase
MLDENITAVLLWITGLSGSGKTTIGKEVYKRLKAEQPNTILLDGDTFREILGSDLGHNREDRFNNAMRIARMCKFLINQNINVICSTMSLFKEIHQYNRENIQNYFEIYLEVDLAEIIRRDQKGIYSNALKNVVGIDLPFDKPENPELIINNTEQDNLDKKAELILKLLKQQ